MRILSRVTFGLVFALSTLQVFATDFYWSCTNPIGNRYADATQCDKGDVGVKVMKNGAAPPVALESTGSGSHPTVTSPRDAQAEIPSLVCPSDPQLCQLPSYGVTEGAPRAQAIARFMRKKECEFLQRFPNRCSRSQ